VVGLASIISRKRTATSLSWKILAAVQSAWHYRFRRREPSIDRDEEGKARELKLAPGRRYTRQSYRVAVQRVCGRAGLPAWSSRQLRHTRATLIRQAYGLEGAKDVLGHADTKITEIYAERDLELAMRIIREIG
jgi:integrase